ncbi:hypothetical protein HK405_002682, partial [Cladochytrium tenue]
MGYAFDENGALKKPALPPQGPQWQCSTFSATKTTSTAFELGPGAQAAAHAAIASNTHAAMQLMKMKE